MDQFNESDLHASVIHGRHTSGIRMWAMLSLMVFTVALLGDEARADRWGKRERVRGSGKMAAETRELSGFTRISVNNSTDIDIKIGESFSVELEAEDNLLELIESEVVRDELRITTDDDYNIRSHRGSRMTITMPALAGLEIRGSSDIRALGISSDFLSIEIRGSGDVELTGSAKEVEIEIKGSGDIDARDLQAKDADIEIRGSGDVRISVEERLRASIHGSGDITYYGDPELKKKIRGSGDISKRAARKRGT
ncbi:MAG: head GIN domain-containing protein [Candidatus Zixiibacteriota bacterium]